MNLRSLVRVLLALALIAVGAGMLLRVLTSDSPRSPEVAVLATATPPPVATPEPAKPQARAAVQRLLIPAIGVDAPAVLLGIDPDGTMQSPSNPIDVAEYTFASRPGGPGNVVIAGHVDYHDYGPAVFWRLRELKPGDRVTVITADGLPHVYAVTSLTVYDNDTAPVAEIVGPTPSETLTLITCTGTFDRSSREYDKRLVVVGQPVSA